jgi:hypothetical protein
VESQRLYTGLDKERLRETIPLYERFISKAERDAMDAGDEGSFAQATRLEHRAARPDPEPYYFGDDKHVWIEKKVERYKAYLERELEQADAWLADALKDGKVSERLVFLNRRPRHRDRKLDLAEKYLVTVRRKILGHSYKDIAMDHVRPKPRTAKQMATAVNRLKSTVRAVWHEAFPKIKRSADR